MCRWEVGNHQGRQKNIAQQKIRACVEVSPWEPLLPLQLSTSNILKPVSDLSQHQHVTKYRFLWTTHQCLWPSQFICIFCQSRITPLCFFPCVFPFVLFPTVLSHCFFSTVFPTHPHTLSPQSALPQPFPSLFIQGLVSLVLCICLKIGLGRETFSSKITKVSVKSCGKLSNRVEHYFAGNTTTLCQDYTAAGRKFWKHASMSFPFGWTRLRFRKVCQLLSRTSILTHVSSSILRRLRLTALTTRCSVTDVVRLQASNFQELHHLSIHKCIASSRLVKVCTFLTTLILPFVDLPPKK